jgi:hypothetical protein
MSLFSFFSNFGDFDSHDPSVNPGSGLPMMNSCFDVAGNPFGSGSDHFGSLSLSSFDSVGSSCGDGFGCSFGGGFSSFD